MRGDGYVLIRVPEGHPCANGAGGRWALEHRFVLHEAGIEIPDGHHVHHRNGVKDDNRRENLEVIAAAEHGSREALNVRPRRFKRPTKTTPRASLARLRDGDWLAAAYAKNTEAALARGLSTAPSVVRYWLAQHGIARRTRAEAHLMGWAERKARSAR